MESIPLRSENPSYQADEDTDSRQIGELTLVIAECHGLTDPLSQRHSIQVDIGPLGNHKIPG